MDRPDLDKCQCSMRTRLVGDGCSSCNPEYWKDMLEEELDEESSELCEEAEIPNQENGNR
jgi:hypothetical protein